jgi:hypothetical protein
MHKAALQACARSCACHADKLNAGSVRANAEPPVPLHVMLCPRYRYRLAGRRAPRAHTFGG